MKTILTLILCIALCVRSQLKLEISSEDLIVPDDKHFNEVSDTLSSSEVDSAKLDFVRRRRRKMMTSTVSPSLKGDPKEPRITMKPSTEILRRNFAKNRLRQLGSHLKEYENRKRRFKPRGSGFNKFKINKKNETDSNDPASSIISNKTDRVKTLFIPDSFPKFDINKTKLDSDKTAKNGSGILTQLQSPITDSFETTNMGRNRVTILDSDKEYEIIQSAETQLPPKYSSSTTSRTLYGNEEIIIKNKSAKHSDELVDMVSNSNESDGFTSLGAVTQANQDADNLVKLGVSIEEVESASKVVIDIDSDNIASNDVTMKDTTADDMDEHSQQLYRFQYKLLPSGYIHDHGVSQSEVDNGQYKYRLLNDLEDVNDQYRSKLINVHDDNDHQSSLISVNAYSPDDGLFHPENAPTYEQFLDDDEVLLKFNNQFGVRTSSEEDISIINDIVEPRDGSFEIFSSEQKDNSLSALPIATVQNKTPPPRPNHPPPKFVKNYQVSIPDDYPLNVSGIKSNPILFEDSPEIIDQRNHSEKSDINLEVESQPILLPKSNSKSNGSVISRLDTPRTPKIEISPGVLSLSSDQVGAGSPKNQVTKSSYSVTTPASYVFFEQTVRPVQSGTKLHPTTPRGSQNNLSRNFDKKRKKIPNKRVNIGTVKVSNAEVSSETEILKNNLVVENKEIDRNIVDNSIEGPALGRLAENANADHYYPNRESYFPSINSYRPGSVVRPHSPIPPIAPPPGIYSPPTTSIHYTPPHHHPTPPQYHPTPPTVINTFHTTPNIPIYQEPPVYTPSAILPNNNFFTQNIIPSYQPPSMTSSYQPPTITYEQPGFIESDIFFKPVKKRPPRRHHKKFGGSKYPPKNSNVSPVTKFHFVEEFSNSPPKTTVKRFPSETSSSLDVGHRPGQGIVSLLKSEDLTVMAALLEETELDRSIDKQGQFTLFVPTDLAFNQFLQKLGGIKENPTELERIVKNHLVRGIVKSEDLADDLVGPSVARTKLRSNVYHSEDRNWKDVKVITINGANVLKTDIKTQDDHGIVHVVDRVLFPPTVGDVMQTLQADPEQRFTTFIKALQATRLDREITDYNTGPWTVFAPTNTAFMNLPMKELEELITNPKKLSKLVLNHLINRTIFSAGMKAHQRLTMANGNRVNLFARDDRLKIEGSNVINMDIPASNGVVQVVENIIEMGKMST